MDDAAARLANRLWKAACAPARRGFARASGRVRATQRALLKRYLDTNRETVFGRRHTFGRLRSVEAFQRGVPLSTYDAYAAFIEQIGHGHQRVLTRDPVLLFEPSSGSTAASKLIPYTASLKKEFRRGVACWIYDLFRHDPDLMNGPAYWSVSPLTQGRRYTPGGVPVGFEQDADYLGGVLSGVLRAALAVPAAVKDAGDLDAFRYATLLCLLRRPGLRIVSVWHPTFLDLLLAPLPGWWDALLDDIAAGTLTPPASLDPHLHEALARRLRPAPSRAADLARARPDDPASLWPHLGLLSCWSDGPAARYARALSRRFPRVPMQGKGLIATEAFVSFPLAGSDGAVLAVTSHFFEFLPVEAATLDVQTDNPRLADDIEVGSVYTVVVTTGGGLYRYRLHDLVEVTGHRGGVPCVRFLGRVDRTSDRFGEKLNDRFVAGVLDTLFRAHRLTPRFALLAPDDSNASFRYALYLEPETPMDGPHRASLGADLDAALRHNFHYDYCRRLGQIGPAAIVPVARGAAEVYLNARHGQGRRLGDVKIPALETKTGWTHRFAQPGRDPAGSQHEPGRQSG